MKIDLIAVADCETSGIDTENDRIIQFFIGLMNSSGEWVEKREWLIDPGIEIPEGASNVHGYTTERLRAEGRKDWQKCIQEIECEILRMASPGVPLVFFNGVFDLSILDAEMRRAGYKWSLKYSGLRIVDSFIIDKHKDKFRKGSRKLVDVAPVYGVPVEANAHDAGADCLMTGRIALKQLAGYRGTLEELYVLQIKAAKEQRESLQAYFKKSGKTEPNGDPIILDTAWPWYSVVDESWKKLSESA